MTSTGQYVVAWDFGKVKKGLYDKYEIKKYEDQVVQDAFKFGDDKEIVRVVLSRYHWRIWALMCSVELDYRTSGQRPEGAQEEPQEADKAIARSGLWASESLFDRERALLKQSKRAKRKERTGLKFSWVSFSSKY